jgi:hypothetical protein
MNSTIKADRNEMIRALQLVLAPGQVTELRALEAVTKDYSRPHTVSGYFDYEHIADMAKAAAGIGHAKGIYFVLNPVNPALLARATNRIRAVGKEPTTSDGDITVRRWLNIDADPVRPTGISSTEAEHEAALAKARQIRQALIAEGWPTPILADSGNGGHLLYAIDFPVDDGGLVQRCLEALAFRFDDAAVTIDQTVHNPARIWKLYGTWACKGDNTTDRPHRLSRVIDAPESHVVVPKALLETMAASAPQAAVPQRTGTAHGGSHPFDINQWIVDHRVEAIGPTPWKNGRKWVLPVCPWNPDHTNHSAYIVQHAGGAIAAGCQHNGCKDNDWHSLRDKVEPGWRDRGSKAGRQPTADVSHPSASDRADEIMLPNSPPWPDPLDGAGMYGLAGEVVRAIEPHTEADPVALLIDLLISYGNMINRSSYFIADGAEHHTNLFAVMVGTTSKGRKGTARAQVHRVISPVDKEWADNRIQSGLSSGEGLIWAVRNPVTKLEPVRGKNGRRTGEKEEVEVDPGVSDKRLVVIEGEFASVLRVASRDGNTLTATIRQAWDRGDLQVLTKNSPAKATGAHISIIGHITRDELLRYLDSTEAGNGFGNRILWLCVRRSKCLPEGGQIQDVDFSGLRQRLAKAVTFGRQCQQFSRDDEAKRIWANVYPELSDGKPGLLGSVTSRAEAQVMRLALIYALLDCSPVIRPAHLMAALAVWDYCLQSAAFIFGDALGDPIADELLRAVRAAGNQGMTRTEIRDLFKRHKGAEQINRVLVKLLEYGSIRREQTTTGGRPAERWFASYGNATKATEVTENT